MRTNAFLLLVVSIFVLALENSAIHSPKHHKYCIIGAGPGGLQVGYFLERSHRDYIIFEKGAGAGEMTIVFVDIEFYEIFLKCKSLQTFSE